MTDEKPNPKPLQVGMLLLDPGTDSSGPHVWTVASRRTLIAHYGNCAAKATLTKSGLPRGWRIISESALAHMLAAQSPDATVPKHKGGQKSAPST